MSKRDRVLPRRVVSSTGGGRPEGNFTGTQIKAHLGQVPTLQRFRLSTSTAGGEGVISGQGIKIPSALSFGVAKRRKKQTEALKEDRCSKSTPEGGSCSSSKARWKLEKASGFLRCCSGKGNVRLREEREVGNPGGKKGSVPSRNGRRPVRLQ